MPKVKVKFDNSNLRVAMAKYAGALKKSLRDTIENSARQIALKAQDQTMRQSQTAGGKKPEPSTASKALTEQTKAWKHRIDELQLPRKYIQHPSPSSHLRKPFEGKGKKKREALAIAMGMGKTTTQYMAGAKSRQGEIASGWNATIFATEHVRPLPKDPTKKQRSQIPAKIRKQGEKHGTYSFTQNGDTATAKIRVHFKGNDFMHIADLAVKQASVAISKQADNTIQADFRNAKKAGRAKRG